MGHRFVFLPVLSVIGAIHARGPLHEARHGSSLPQAIKVSSSGKYWFNGIKSLVLIQTTYGDIPWRVLLVSSFHVMVFPQAGFVIASPSTQNPDFGPRASYEGDDPSSRGLIDISLSSKQRSS